MGVDSIGIILGALGGVTAFLAAVVTVARAIFRQVNATEENTAALRELRTTVQTLDRRVARLEGQGDGRRGR